MGQKWSQAVIGECPENEQTWSAANKYYKELLTIDQCYSQLMADGVKAFLDFRLTETQKPDDVKKTVLDSGFARLSGSCSDGGGTCRWFRNCQADVEIDIMYEVGKISPQDEAAILEMLPAKPGFAKVRNCSETFASVNPLLTRERTQLSAQFNTGQPGQEHVDTALMQEIVTSIMPHRDKDGEVSRIAAALMDIDESDLQIFVTEKVEGPSVLMELIVSLKEDPKILYSSDTVLALKIVEWPKLLDQWLQREDRCWQKEHQDLIDTCVKQGCHLVAKKSPTERDANTEWRLSFSYMEQILMTSWNEHQKLCYYFLKSLFYRHLRGIEHGKIHIPSYALKTSMLWVSEHTKSSDWIEANLKKNSLKVLKKLEDDLKACFIPNYFIPSMNVIDPATYPSSLTEQVAERVSSIRQNLEGNIPKDMIKMTRLGNAILTAMKAILAYFQFTALKASIKRRTDGRRVSDLDVALQAISGGMDVLALLQGFIGKK